MIDKIYDLEKDLEADAIRHAKRHGWWTRKYAHPRRRAAPDRVFVKAGRHFYVEFKRLGNSPTKQQMSEAVEMRAAGMDVVWVDSIEDFVAVLRDREIS